MENREPKAELTMQTWISLLAEKDGSHVMKRDCSKEKFLTTFKCLSWLHTPSTVKPCTKKSKKTRQQMEK